MSAKSFALVDCNNFYVSCERLFQPKLRGRPVVVLSNNDGCIIARSNEAKALGIGMGSPFFKWSRFLAANDVEVFSSNYPLYGDVSHRVMSVLQQLEPEVEIYSIDEAFLRLGQIRERRLGQYGLDLRSKVYRHTGIPVSIGIGPTKTLAKIASRIAKKDDRYHGVFDITECLLDERLSRCPVADVWGIGRRQAGTLGRRGVKTALDLKNCDDEWLRRNLTVTGLRTAMELRGISCIGMENSPASKKSISSSKSFGCPVASLDALKEALATYAAQAAVKLRRQGSLACSLQVSITTNPFRKEACYSARQVVTLCQPTSSTTVLIRHALGALAGIYKPGHVYQKAGIVLFGLVSRSHFQPGLFGSSDRGGVALMEAMDKINDKWGRHCIQHAVAGMTKPWKNRQGKKSPSYTTSWQELPVVR